MILTILTKILVIILCISGVFLSFMTIGGTFVITLAYFINGLSNKFNDFSILFLIILLILSIIGEIIEFFATSIGTKKFGASDLTFFTTLIFGIIGGIIGTFMLPLLGTLLGTVLGATLAAFATEYLLKGKAKPAINASIGVLAGKTGSILIKTFLSLIMAISVIIAIF